MHTTARSTARATARTTARATARATVAGVLAAGLLALGTGAATANPDDNFEPGPDYDNFQPGPDYDNFQPGAAPGTADLVDDTVARLLGVLGIG